MGKNNGCHPAHHCTEWGTKYLAWVRAAPDVRDQHRALYERHMQTCPTCRQDRAALTEFSRTAVHPELEEA